MGSGKGGSTKPVYDFLMSIDYGLCHGPVDHVNQIWIKDKTVMADQITRRTDIEVSKPDIYGGDDSEGGVEGVIEVYTGSTAQVSSWELTQRPGLDPDRMPGYRGIAHLFLRGLRDWGNSDANAAAAGFGSNFFLTQTVRKLLSGVSRPALRAGWKWGSNNPYQPPVKASVTRLPGLSFASPHRAIWPLSADYDAHDPEPEVEIDPREALTVQDESLAPSLGDVVDLYSLGITEAAVTAGVITVSASWVATLTSWSGLSASEGTARTRISFHAAAPTTWAEVGIAPIPEDTGLDEINLAATPTGDNEPGGGAATATITSAIDALTVPTGARYVQFQASYSMGLGTLATVSDGATRTVTEGAAPAVPVVDGPGSDFYTPPDDDLRSIGSGPMTVNTYPSIKLGDVIDLYELGITQAEIDGGFVKVASAWTGTATQSGPFDLSASFVVGAIAFHAVVPVNYYDNVISPLAEDAGLDSYGESQLGNLSASLGPITVPPGGRYVQYRAAYSGAVGRTTTITSTEWVVGYMSYSAQHVRGDSVLGPLPDANPSNMIYDCMTNRDWGKGEPASLMDLSSFTGAAETLYNERMGMSLTWFAQSKIESFVGEVLDHIQGFLFQDPATGRWTLKLLRGDYDIATLRTLDETNCVATNRKRRLWGETINEIVVSYTVPETEKEATVSAHDLGNIAIQGGIISETRDYHGFRNAAIAQVVADRDVRAASYPLFSCHVEVDRREWDARPGDVRKFSWPEDGIVEIIMRVMTVDYGEPGNRKIKLELTEDIFSIESATYSSPQTSQWSDPTIFPTTLDAQLAVTIPLPVLVLAGQLIPDIDENYPSVAVGLLADDTTRPIAIDVRADVVKANGTTAHESIGSINVTRSGRITTALAEEIATAFPLAMVEGIARAAMSGGEIFMLGESEADSELVMLDTYDSATQEWTVARGLWDTVPRAWPAGTRLWRFDMSAANADPSVRSSGETVEYTLLPRTNIGSLAVENAVPFSATFSERPFAPFRPANVQIDGLGFGSLEVHAEPYPTEIVATWATRNRTTEDQVSVRWDEGDAAMEAGQTVVLRILDDLGNLHGEITGLTGSTATIAVASLPPALQGYIEFVSDRDGYRSVYAARRYFDIRPPVGYGLSYGMGYGGA